MANKTLGVIKLIIIDFLKFQETKGLENDQLRNVYNVILFKTIHSFEGAVFLLSNFSKKPFFQITFASAMRDIISDLIIAEYLSLKSLDSSVDMDMVLEKLDADHFLFMYQKRKLNREIFGHNEGYDEAENYFLNSMSQYLDKNGEIKKRYRKKSLVFDKISFINSRTKKESKGVVIFLYNWYFNSSKIAHLGGLTLKVIETRFSATDQQSLMKNYKDLIFMTLAFCSGMLIKVSNNLEVNPEIEKGIKEILELKVP
ncbi:MAG: hypothetical protein KDC85_01000 [Saprospiraceae bacterium]|nr:hypothetical protein [Saprospiraceae bacterium]MCB9326873.1 hypothetical protein [Lewinellaceae bacterium]